MNRHPWEFIDSDIPQPGEVPDEELGVEGPYLPLPHQDKDDHVFHEINNDFDDELDDDSQDEDEAEGMI